MNFLFANTPLGAKASAIMYSMIETAKENGLDPFAYLVWIFHTAPGTEIPLHWNESCLSMRHYSAVRLKAKRPFDACV